MKVTVLLAMLAISAPLPAPAQTWVSGERGRPQRSTDGPRPRPSPPRPSPTGSPFRSTLIVTPVPVPHRAFPVRLPWFGLVLFDSYWWASSGVDRPTPAPPFADDGRPKGALQLDVDPRRALVYVDGWFVGIVESFSGYYRNLDLAAGWHQIELIASDYEPLVVDIVVSPGRTTTYRGSLNRDRD